MLKIISIIGARPQFIKAVPVSRAINEFNAKHDGFKSRIREILVHTGQHYDYNMSDIFFKELDLKKPDYYLKVGSHSHGRQTALMLERIEGVLKKESPDLVLVYGDTNSTLAGALAARKLHILLAHIEAGLRSYNMNMPEEVNRTVVDRVSDILFCPSKTAVDNLRLEGIRNSSSRTFPKVFLAGDVMYDAVLCYLTVAKKRSRILEKLSLTPKGYYLATVHRAENTDDRRRLKPILEGLSKIAEDKAPVIFPIHPRAKNAVRTFRMEGALQFLKVIEPVSYLDMLMLEKNARAVLTDSGGVQKEAYFLNVPCVTLRDETEWVETVDSKVNILTGADKKKIYKAVEKEVKFDKKKTRLYGDGKAAERIIGVIASQLSVRDKR
ncbi:MAG: UDP-N-acetylglucosamine 2-epimerase (non-hydrolyzing) [Candidatus Omnitrophota bacterium]|nr:UDP-N-acetylglucosamine 2-epimerase (non-hydrolyzing) [Candidatus Omnitrophota bacterium]